MVGGCILWNSRYLAFSAVVSCCCGRRLFSVANRLSLAHPVNWAANKPKKKPIHLVPLIMDAESEKILAPLRISVKEQGDVVRSLKASGAAELDVKKAVNELKARKKILEDRELSLVPAEDSSFDRFKMEDLLKRRFFYDQSFAIYGGVTGQYDFGPMGCALKANIIAEWRKFFVLAEQMLEVDCTVLTPETVLKASGHVDRFADFMVKDTVNGECFRLDHLIKVHLEKQLADTKISADVRDHMNTTLARLDSLSKEQLNSILRQYDIKSPLTGHPLTDAIEFNLMFGTSIGPTGSLKGFLRPETAQGMFVNFKRLLEFNQGRLPFAAAQIGNAFRNEISPRSGLIRVREFTMAEIEHFCDPDDKQHAKFSAVAQQSVRLFCSADQMDGQPARCMSIGQAVTQGVVANETLGYFMARIQQFLLLIGISARKLRFRQHLCNEMAHYATDCWDAEILTSYGWVECVGCADRSAYDLTQHSRATGVKLVVSKRLAQPQTVDVIEPVINKGVLGKTFKKEAKHVSDALLAMSDCQLVAMETALKNTGSYILEMSSGGASQDVAHTITEAMVTVRRDKRTLHSRDIVPSVVEPSFGVGRLMYALLEHSFRVRQDDDQRSFFSLPPVVAPIKCSVLPLSGNAEFQPLANSIMSRLVSAGVYSKLDDSSGSIGRRYARTDEIAIPYGVTVDFDSVNRQPSTVTLRERDSRQQLRIPVDDIVDTVAALVLGRSSWTEACVKYPLFEQQVSSATGD